MVTPLFMFSLPRSGSTLLQRVLAADHHIASVAEPWVLLPFVYALREEGIRAEYGHPFARMALQDFFLELPNGKQDFLSAVGSAVRELYGKTIKTGKARYFLDKTPRYALIADDIIEIFPDGKFIFLWRNPLAVIASIIETWGAGKWNIHMYEVDFFKSLPELIDTYRSHAENVLALQYESFLSDPEKELGRIQEYLELEINREVLTTFSQVHFKGQLGDPTGSKTFQAITAAPLTTWRSVLNTPFRKMWCRRYLQWLGKERLKIMGYDLHELIRELDSMDVRWKYMVSDSVRMLNVKNRTVKFLRGVRQSLSPDMEQMGKGRRGGAETPTL